MEASTPLHHGDLNGTPHYPLKTLDQLVMVELNPIKSDLSNIDESKSEKYFLQLTEEEAHLQLLIKSQIFNLTTKSEVELLIRRYHTSLIILLDQCLENQRRNSKNRLIKELHKAALFCLEKLLSFIETHYPEYLDRKMRAPATYFAVTQKEMRRRVELLKIKALKFPDQKSVAEIIFKNLDRFTKGNIPYEVTFLTILYYKGLVKGLEKLQCNTSEGEAFSALDVLLVYMNFNSKAYISHLTGIIKIKVNACETVNEKMDVLLYCHKAFNQLYSKPELIFNPNYYDLKTIIGNWFVQEIRYLEEKIKWSTIPLQETAITKNNKPKTPQKILVRLSSDQAGLIFRAADDLRIVVAKSLSEVFKTIVPHLSTPNQEDLSYKGMRTQSYVAEERDKEIAIETLERIIKKIREYGKE